MAKNFIRVKLKSHPIKFYNIDLLLGCHDIRRNDTQQSNIHHDDMQHNGTKHDDLNPILKLGRK